MTKLHDSGQSMILSQVEEEKRSFSVPGDGGLPEWVGEESGTPLGSKGRLYAAKSFAISSELYGSRI